MDAMEPKKLALLRILQILQMHSCADHPLTQEEIASLLEHEYGIVVERKAIGRNLSLLREAGFEIASSRSGSYLSSRLFEDSELRMLIDGVLCSKYITARHSKELIGKLCGLTNKFFRAHVTNIHSVNEWSKTDNQALFFNIELIDEAIDLNRQLCFDYNKYGTDKKLHRTTTHHVSPYQLVLHNQRYYLMALNERWQNIGYYRVDHITEMTVTDKRATPLQQVKGYEHGIDYRALSTGLPYMFTDGFERIEFYAEESIVDQVVDWFGDNAEFKKDGDRLKVTVKASPKAMEFWAMQYLTCVQVISPPSLVERIRQNLQEGLAKYQ